MSETINNIDKIILDYLDGQNSKEDLQLLKQWLSEDPENKNELKNLTEIYLASNTVKPDFSFDSNLAWSKWENKYTSQPINNENQYSFININKQILKIAAISLILMVSGFFLYRFLNVDKSEKLSFFEYNVPRGSRSHIYLPDGTSVWLNAQSKLKYNQVFGQNQREVFLEGEAYFEVVRNEKLPFIVKASDATVKVLGTTFNVKAYPEENFIETTVVKGKVQVSSPQINNEGQDKITLLANQKVKILKESAVEETVSNKTIKKDSAMTIAEELAPLAIKKVDFSPNITAQIYTSWKDSQWIIERETLKELAIKIERRYNVSIYFKDSTLEQFIFSGKLKDESLEQVLQAISVASPVVYTINQKQIFFSHKYKLKK